MPLRKTNLAWKASQAAPVRQMVLQMKPVPPLRLDLIVQVLHRWFWFPRNDAGVRRRLFGGRSCFHLRSSRLAAEGHLS